MSAIDLKKEIYVRGNDGALHSAKLRIRERKCRSRYGDYTARYLYLTYRDGDKVNTIYVMKL